MNEKFITKGIENDRYLKAVRLYKEFEEEMVRKLRNLTKETVEREPELFVDDGSLSKSLTRRRTTPLGHMRMQTDLRRVNSDGERLKLYYSIEWVQPEVHGHEEPTDGALCLVLYKIKKLGRADYERVKQRTQSRSKWDDVQFTDDVWNNDWGIFYVPVTDGSDVKEGFRILQEHFLEFGESFGELPDSDPV